MQYVKLESIIKCCTFQTIVCYSTVVSFLKQINKNIGNKNEPIKKEMQTFHPVYTLLCGTQYFKQCVFWQMYCRMYSGYLIYDTVMENVKTKKIKNYLKNQKYTKSNQNLKS